MRFQDLRIIYYSQAGLAELVKEVSAAWMAAVKPTKHGRIHGVLWNKQQ
jgi:hypothetical protein